VELEEDLGCSILERYLLNSSFLISSKNGTGIFTFRISFSKLKEEGDSIISLIYGTRVLITV
jgi:hypothetical protein